MLCVCILLLSPITSICIHSIVLPSHEIRTPLSVCKLGLDLVQATIGAQCSADNADTLKNCQDSIEIAVTILNDLLSYEKLESGMIELFCDICPGVAFVTKALAPFSLQVGPERSQNAPDCNIMRCCYVKAQHKEVEFKFHVHCERPDDIFVYIDDSKMSQVVIYL